jgi:hypothetical protein
MKLRLLLHTECKKSCEYCCNKKWDLVNLPKVVSFKGYKEIMLTGGEPMLYPYLIIDAIYMIREEDKTVPIYLYTADVSDVYSLITLLRMLNGLTVTLHNQSDVESFKRCNSFIDYTKRIGWEKSLRLNVFKGIDLGSLDLSLWQVKKDMEWIKNCPLPHDEVFMRF